MRWWLALGMSFLACPAVAVDMRTIELAELALDVAPGTPGGVGWLRLAEGDIATARQRIAEAQTHSQDLRWVAEHVADALNALDPSVVASGPGSGYGARTALSKFVAAGQDMSRDEPALRDAQAALVHTEQAVAVGRRVMGVTRREDMDLLVRVMDKSLLRAAEGFDVNRDGRLDSAAGEGGLGTATARLAQLRDGVDDGAGLAEAR